MNATQRNEWKLMLWGACLLMTPPLNAQEVSFPKVRDPRLELSLVASEPHVVTPVALAADRSGRLFVLETNTHARNSAYQGPEDDRVLVFEDSNGDGQYDRQRICLDGLRNALSMVLARDGRLFVLQMKSVLVFSDTNGDGSFDSPQTLLTIETDNNNHHGVFLALALDDRNRLYVTLGNIGGQAYTVRGSDEATVTGQGDTGLIVRCQDDGSDVARFAHGFWNPCGLKFDSAGRLLATDNDPDARGPNRVLHVIQGGRYGYQSRFGASGRHPFDSWDGELPGTLPMIAGVGEAPVGLLDCNATSLPVDYQGDLLVAVWGTNRVDRIRTRASGALLMGDVEPLISGNEGFRPTGIVATSSGTVYIADWADRRYPVHGKGRIWRLSVKGDPSRLEPALPFSRIGEYPQQHLLSKVADGDGRKSFDELMKLATGDDPFLASAAVTAMGHGKDRDELGGMLRNAVDPKVRLAALLALRDAVTELDAGLLEQALRDKDPRVRQTAMICLGESMRLDLADALADSMALQTATPELFETFLAATELLTEAEAQRVRDQIPGTRIDRRVDQSLLRRLIADPDQPGTVRAMALRYVDVNEASDDESRQWLVDLAGTADLDVAREAVQTLGASQTSFAAEKMLALAEGRHRDGRVRADAIMSIGALTPDIALRLARLARDPDATVALTAARALGKSGEGGPIGAEFGSILDHLDNRAQSQRLSEQLRFALERPAQTLRPVSDEQWDAVLSGGDAEAGRRVFFDRRVTCAKCHRAEGRGGVVGPDLTNVAKAKTAQQILRSILHPSQERSPDYQGYAVVMLDGQIHLGTQFHFRGESAELLTMDGKWIRFALKDTEDYRALESSLMPEGLVDLMSVGELQDLMAYLTFHRD